MPQLNAYLSFDGQCVEAMNFYAKVLGGTVDPVITYGDAPAKADDPPVPAEHADRVMHACLMHPDFVLMAGDNPPGVPFESMKGVMLTLTYDSVADAKRVFDQLAAGGTVTMPMAGTFWAEAFGMVTDRFGTGWGINGGRRAM
jgi:PhnB protein